MKDVPLMLEAHVKNNLYAVCFLCYFSSTLNNEGIRSQICSYKMTDACNSHFKSKVIE